MGIPFTIVIRDLWGYYVIFECPTCNETVALEVAHALSNQTHTHYCAHCASKLEITMSLEVRKK